MGSHVDREHCAVEQRWGKSQSFKEVHDESTSHDESLGWGQGLEKDRGKDLFGIRAPSQALSHGNIRMTCFHMKILP